MTSALVWLLAEAAKVDLKLFRRRERTPLQLARYIEHKECLAVMLSAGAT